MLLWRWIQPGDNQIISPFLKYLLIVFALTTRLISFMKELYVELSFVVPILALWLTSLDFQQIVQKEYQLGKQFEMTNYKSIHIYRKVAQLSRVFSKIQGFQLVMYLFHHILYYSSTLDELFRSERAGLKFYRLELVCTFSAVYGLSSCFCQNVTQIAKNIT